MFALPYTCIMCDYVNMINLIRIERAEENDNKWWYILMLTVSIVLYVMSLVGIILMYVFFIEVSYITTLLHSTCD